MVEKSPLISNRMSVPAGMRSQDSASLTAREVCGILRRHIFLIFILTVFGFIAGFGVWKVLQKYYPKYNATTYIKILSPTPSDPWVIGGVQPQKDILYAHRRSIANLIKQQSMLEYLLDNDTIRKTKWYQDKDSDIVKLVRSLKNSFVAFPQRDSDFVELSMTAGNAEESAVIVNKMVELFLAKQMGVEKEEVTQKLKPLNDQRKSIQKDLDNANDGLSAIRNKAGILDLEMPETRNFRHTVTQILESIELEQINLDMGLEQLKADIKNLQELADGPINEQIEILVEKDPIMLSLAQQLTEQQTQLSALRTRFGEGHRDVIHVREMVAQTLKQRDLRKEEIANQTRLANLENARDGLYILQERYDKLSDLRAEAQKKKTDLDTARIEFDKQLKIRDERLDMLKKIDEQIEKVTSLLNDPEIPKIQSVGPAPAPLEMILSRQWYMWLPTLTMLGLLLGISLAFMGELTNDQIATPSEVSRFLRIPLLSVIPDVSEEKLSRGVELRQIVRQAPYSMISESYRRLRANLMLSGPLESLKTILVASGMSGEGKTSTAVNLALVFVASGKKVLLIDANFRNPNLHVIFPRVEGQSLESLESQHFNFGLSSVLMHQCKTENAIRSSGIEGLSIIDCGPMPANPSDLLGSIRMDELVRELRRNYDHIIIDGAPVLLVSDSTVLASLADATLLVFCADDTNTGAAQRTIREIKGASSSIVGCVLFAARARTGGYFKQQYKSYRKYQKKQRLAYGI
ncbi:MAG: polysaccharide biosynthesis tyrosine autokinase [Sedimentisphaerales bacterium]|nr:polysaccharide biosynthesis tyrosine autokinase [Sedimentisphaerales bacterium]